MEKYLKVDNYYLLNEVIGKDSYGNEYYLAYRAKNKFLIKKYKRQKPDENNLQKRFIRHELFNFQYMSHKNIIKAKDVKKTKNHIYIIMQYCNGASLKENMEKYIIKYGKPFSEKITQHIIRQIFDVINYLNIKSYVNYDLPLEDILLNYYSEETKNNLDIFHSDLILANLIFAEHYLKNALDIILIVKRVIDKIFLFSYYLFTGDLSFKIIDDNDLMKKEIKIPINLSLEAISFLINILKNYQDKIENIEELSNHPFLKKYFGDFVDIDIKSISKFIKDEYIVFNINNVNEIHSIIRTHNIDKI